jgi:hypothetical protein
VDTEERGVATWCETHPGRPAVATCESCGRRVCLTCAVPVRGRVLGPECLATELGDEGLPAPPPPRRRLPLWPTLAVVGALIAVVAAIVPWARFGPGSGAFGGLATPRRWAALPGALALPMLVLAVAALRARRRGSMARWPFVVLSLVALASAAGAMMALLRPPAFTRLWVGPWVALVGAIVAAAAAAAASRRPRPPAEVVP